MASDNKKIFGKKTCEFVCEFKQNFEVDEMANFLTILGGDHTINVNMISEVDWTAGDEEATVTMCTGKKYTCEGDDYWALRQAMGMDVEGLEALAA